MHFIIYCHSHIELYDVVMEGQKFQQNGFELNPVIRMAIMRKVLCSHFH